MNDLADLYQDLIIEHYRRPRNHRLLEDANRSAEGFNPLCGDHVTLYLKVKDGIVEDVSFVGTGCAISTASASLLTESVKGRTEAEAQALIADFQRLVTSEEVQPDLGKLQALAGVRRFPARVKCATLAWHTLRAALTREPAAVSTE